MSKSSIPEKIKNQLLVKSAGRCQFRGCNISLYQDIITKKDFNKSYIAHIVGDVPTGPRGDATRSPLLAKSLANLMLLCDGCHRRIDANNGADFTEAELLSMKKEHEDRIETVTAIAPNMQSHILTYKANVGAFTPNLSYQIVSQYLSPTHYPAMADVIDLSYSNSLNKDSDDDFWQIEESNLKKQFDRKLSQPFTKGEILHLSVFAFAPMPLLIKLGTLINNIYPVEIHQKIRVPDTWNLSDEKNETVYKLIEPVTLHPQKVALNISLSASINNERIYAVMGDDCSIYTLTIDTPNPNFLQNKQQLKDFGLKVMKVLDLIKSKYDGQTPLSIFPAMPIATAIEFGRVWFPKADMPLHIYDENTAIGGFKKALEISNE